MIRALLKLASILCLIAFFVWLAIGGRLLVRNAPEKSDAILVLDGENNVRVQRGLELLRAGYAPELVLDVVSTEVYFGFSKVDLARDFVAKLPSGEREHVHVCAVDAYSTKEEAQKVVPCLQSVRARKVLIATSEEHTVRALNTFRHELPQYSFSVAAAVDRSNFGVNWWQHRRWAKMFFEEWVRFAWFEAVDRWR